MMCRSMCAILCVTALAVTAAAVEPKDPEAAIDEVLSSFHAAASEANGDLYFSLFAEGAVFMGTDATERWSVDQFKAFAEPYFSEGRGWTYTKTERHIFVSAEGTTAWFDEVLWNEAYGTCRGTGVLMRTEDGWRISQYNLTIPIPNDLTREFANRIKARAESPTPMQN
jgi:ketosteroid isomerase-like protein